MSEQSEQRCGICGKREQPRHLTGLRWAGRPDRGRTTLVCRTCCAAIDPLDDVTAVTAHRPRKRMRRLIPAKAWS